MVHLVCPIWFVKLLILILLLLYHHHSVLLRSIILIDRWEDFWGWGSSKMTRFWLRVLPILIKSTINLTIFHLFYPRILLLFIHQLARLTYVWWSGLIKHLSILLRVVLWVWESVWMRKVLLLGCHISVLVHLTGGLPPKIRSWFDLWRFLLEFILE